ncbi:MAG: hypothetical protein J5896_04500 [Alphaproteobacteria bacterium]|nr:hypothetical protein [Alphaproteobacteria bacterium]
MKYILLFCALFYACDAFAQVSPSMQDAAYLATLKAVLDYKMEDEKNAEKIEMLRHDEKFNAQLEKKLKKLNNGNRKTATDRRVYQMLIQSGQNIYNELH